MPSPYHYHPFLSSCRWYRQLDAELQAALLQGAELREFAKNACVFRTGDACDGLSIIVEGSVRVIQNVNGKDALLGVFAAPFWLGEMSIIDGDGRQHDVYADQPLRVLHVPMAAVQALLARRPDFYRHLGLLVCTKLRLAICALQDNSVESTAVRIARRLLVMASAYGAWTDRTALNLQVSQEQLAAMLGTSRQTVSVILRDMESRGSIRIAYGRIELLDMGLLHQMANASPLMDAGAADTASAATSRVSRTQSAA